MNNYADTAVQEAMLRCYPTSSWVAISDIRVLVQRVSASQLQLNYRVCGELNKIRIPLVAQPERRDELWKHTCAELFVAEPGQAAYVEFNLAPSTCWAAYEFSDYRQGMRAAACEAPQIVMQQAEQMLEINARIQLPMKFATVEKLQLSATMVIEDATGQYSYWAVQHAADKPDFHCRASFVLNI